MRALFRLLPLLLLLLFSSAAYADELDLSAYKGKVVYLDFWASWCTPCRLSFPFMNELQRTYGPRGLVVLAVNVDKDQAAAAEFLREQPAGFKIVYDPAGHIASQFNFRDMPTSVLIGRDGRQRFVHSGFVPGQESEYAAHVNGLINEG